MGNNSVARNNNGGYRLSLNGFHWNLASDPALQGWLDRLASLTEIAPAPQGRHPRLMFTSKQSNDSRGHSGELPPDYDYQTLRIWRRASGDLTIEVNNEEGPDSETVNMWSAMFPIYLKAAEHRGLAIHAGLVEFNGRGVLLAGPGNTGKSTCCRRLPLNWKVWSDDLSLVVWDLERGYLVHPFPTWSEYLWDRASGKTWNVQYSVPLQAVIFLEKSAHDEIIPIDSRSRAAIRTNGAAVQIYHWFWQRLASGQRRSQARMVFENACDLARVTPAYILRFSLNGKFWELIENECL
jgi:SynChlorMet cassette protein ScmC